MLHRMARRALTRERTVALTLGALILLSVTLAATGTGLLARLTGASDALLERARAPHLAQMHAGDLSPEQLEAWVAGRAEVTAMQIQQQLGIDGTDLQLDGRSQAGSIQQNSLVVPNTERDLLLDLDGGVVGEVEPGTVWLPVYYEIEHDLEVGELVTITDPSGYLLELTVAGFLRDSIMNTAVASSKRLAVSEQDFAAAAEHTGTREHLIAFWVADPQSEVSSLRTAYLQQGLPAAGPMVDRSAFSLFNLISEGMVAAVALLVAASVLLVGLLCLRLALIAAMARDQRENGVLVALGIPISMIRRMHVLKYGTIAVPASGLGLIGGLFLSPVLAGSLTRYLGGAGGAAMWLWPAVTALALLGVVLVVVAAMTRRLRRLSAVQALRSGDTGAGRGPGRLRLHRSRLPVNISLGLMDVVRRARMYLLLLFVLAVSAMLVTVPSATAGTLRSPDFSAAMGLGTADLRMDLQHEGPQSAEQFAAAQVALADDEGVRAHSALVTTRHLIHGGEGGAVTLPVDNGDHESLPVTYAAGRAARSDSEIALSLIALLESGTEVGGTVVMEVGGESRELTVVGSYQDITHGGLTAKAMLDTDDEEVMRYVLGARLDPAADAGAAAERLSAQLDGVKVAEVAEVDRYLDQILGPLATAVSRVSLAAAAIAATLGALITSMFVQMLRAGNAGPDGIQRALGATRGDLCRQYLTRTLAVAVLGTGLGVLAGKVVGEGVLNLMVEGMLGGTAHLFQGASRIDLVIDPVLTFVGVPAALCAVIVATTIVTYRSTPELRIGALTAE